MNKAIVIISALLLPALAYGDGPGYKCFNLSGGLEILKKLDDHKYVADFWNWGTPRLRIVLITEKTKFISNGVVTGEDLWVKIPTGKAEKTEITESNGFSKSYETLRESDVCAKEGPAALAKQKAPDPKNEPCEKTDEDGTIITNPYCKDEMTDAQVKKDAEDRQKFLKLKGDCEDGYKDASSPECQKALKNR